MYLSDRDLAYAIKLGHLIVDPTPEIDPTSIDLRLDNAKEAKVWDIARVGADHAIIGHEPNELRIGKFHYQEFSEKYLILPPEETESADTKVFRRGKSVLVKPGGFLLWTTKEVVGTPRDGARLISFVDGKSTRARTGIVVHMTAPTIHGGWSGKITLEIGNFGPFTFVLEEDDVIAQLVVAQLSSVPERSHEQAGSVTQGQVTVSGKAAEATG